MNFPSSVRMQYSSWSAGLRSSGGLRSEIPVDWGRALSGFSSDMGAVVEVLAVLAKAGVLNDRLDVSMAPGAPGSSPLSSMCFFRWFFRKSCRINARLHSGHLNGVIPSRWDGKK